MELDHGAEDVRGRFVERARLTRIDQARGATGDAVAQFVAGDVEVDHRPPLAAVTVAEADAIAVVRPEGIDHAAAVVDAAEGAGARAVDTQAAVDLGEIVPGAGDAVMRIRAGGGGVANRVAAPDVVPVGEHHRGPRGCIAHVGGRGVAAQRIAQLVGIGATLRGRQGHVAGIQGAPLALGGRQRDATAARRRLCGFQTAPAVEHARAARIHDVGHLDRIAHAVAAIHAHLPGELRGGGAARVDDQLGKGHAGKREAESDASGDDRVLPADRRLQRHLGRAGLRE